MCSPRCSMEPFTLETCRQAHVPAATCAHANQWNRSHKGHISAHVSRHARRHVASLKALLLAEVCRPEWSREQNLGLGLARPSVRQFVNPIDRPHTQTVFQYVQGKHFADLVKPSWLFTNGFFSTRRGDQQLRRTHTRRGTDRLSQRHTETHGERYIVAEVWLKRRRDRL